MGAAIRHRVVIGALTCGLCQAVASADRQHPYRNAASVCIEPTTRDHLSGTAFTTLRSEAARIWLPHGIALTWTPPSPSTCDAVVRVVFDHAQLRTIAGPKRDDALAVTVFSGRSQVVYVSAPRVFQLLAQIHESISALETSGERDFRGGTLIGRVVAHELGHVLLTTTAHTGAGLMRPRFGIDDALSADAGTTDLSSAESNRLAMRFSLVPREPQGTPELLAQRGR